MTDEPIHSDEWIQLPEDAVKDLDLPKDEGDDVQGFQLLPYNKAFLKIAPGGPVFGKGDLTGLLPAVDSGGTFNKSSPKLFGQ